jgi:hypothetical protein
MEKMSAIARSLPRISRSSTVIDGAEKGKAGAEVLNTTRVLAQAATIVHPLVCTQSLGLHDTERRNCKRNERPPNRWR